MMEAGEGRGMDDNLRLFLWVLAGAGFFALLGGAFGAFTGAVNWRQGQAAGTGLGLRVLRAFAALSERELEPGERGAIVGGADGLVFGAAVGTLIGLLAGWTPGLERRVLGPAAVGGLLLVAGAVLFGGLAWGAALAGLRAILGLFAGGMLGAVLGIRQAGMDGLFFGTAGGAVLGTLVVVLPALINRRRGPPRDP